MNPLHVNSEVFSINFIRRPAIALPARRVVLYMALGYLGLQLIGTVGLLGTGIHSFVKRYGLEKGLAGRGVTLSSLNTLRGEVEALHGEASNQLKRFNAALALETQRLPIAGKWAALTETLPSRTWITRLSGSRDQRLIRIQAVYVVDTSKPFDLPIKKWTEALKADPRFGTGLKRIDLETSSRSGPQDQVSLYSFDLIAEWKPA